MTDRELKLVLDPDRYAVLQAAAEDAGESVEAFATRLITRGLKHDDWAISEARVEEYRRTGVAEEAETVFRDVRDHLQKRLAERQAPAK
jgi:hypothetical protein